MTSLYNPISKCFVVSKHGVFITYPTNYDVIILHDFVRRSRKPALQIHLGIVYCHIVEVDRIRIEPSWLSNARACRVIHEWGFI